MAFPLFMVLAATTTVSVVYGVTKTLQSEKGELISSKLLSRFKQAQAGLNLFQSQPLTEAIPENRLRSLKRPNEKVIRRNINVALVSLGVAVVGSSLSIPALALFSAVGLFYATRAIYIQAYQLLKSGKIGIDVLNGLAIGAGIISGYLIVTSLVVLVFLMSLRLLLKVTDDSREQLLDVFEQIPKSVWMLVDGAEIRVPFNDIKVGDRIVVNAGETIPVDGVICEGIASVDQHILTGEAAPAEKVAQQYVYALTTVLSGRIIVKVDQAGEETTVAKIGEILSQTIDFQSQTELRALTLSDQTVKPTLLLGALALLTVGPYGAIGVLNAHFRYRIMLVMPMSILNYFKVASQHGILIKDGRSLDLLPQVNTLVFDKTGTLTQEQPSVSRIHCYGDNDEQSILQYAVTAESRQSHPIARAILHEAEVRGVEPLEFDEANYQMGYGLTVSVGIDTVRVGSQRFMQACEVEIPEEFIQTQDDCHLTGHSLVAVACNCQIIGAIELIPTVRPEAGQIIHALKQHHGIKEIYIISGDHENPTRALAQELGIDHYFAGALPEEKAELVQSLRDEGKFICYIGDGINDALAMKHAQISVSLSGASNVATDTANVVLLDGGLSQLPFLFRLAKDFRGNSNTMFSLIATPTVLGIGGVFLLGYGMAGTVALGMAGLFAAGGVAMLPLLKYRYKNKLLDQKN